MVNITDEEIQEIVSAECDGRWCDTCILDERLNGYRKVVCGNYKYKKESKKIILSLLPKLYKRHPKLKNLYLKYCSFEYEC